MTEFPYDDSITSMSNSVGSWENVSQYVDVIEVITWSNFLECVPFQLSQLLEEVNLCEYIPIHTDNANKTLISANKFKDDLDSNNFFKIEVEERCMIEEGDNEYIDRSLFEIYESEWEEFEDLIKLLTEKNIFIDVEN